MSKAEKLSKENQKIGAMIMVRVPIGGSQSKTRIGKAINNQSLANLLALKLARTTVESLASLNIDVYIYHQILKENVEIEKIQSFFGSKIVCSYSDVNGLDKLCNRSAALEILLKLGYDKAIVLPSDCPYLTPQYLEKFVSKIGDYDAVLCKSSDDGINAYGISKGVNPWCIAVSLDSHTPLSDNLIQDVSNYLEKQELNYKIVTPTLSDIDTLHDLQEFWRFLRVSTLLKEEHTKGIYQEIYIFLEENRDVLMLD